MIGSVPGSSSYLAKLMKGEEKMNELVGKIQFLLMKAILLNFLFLWYSLNPDGNGEIICELDSWLWLFGSLFPWTSLEKNWALTIRAR